MVDVVDVGLKLKCPKYGLKKKVHFICAIGTHFVSLTFTKNGSVYPLLKEVTKEALRSELLL